MLTWINKLNKLDECVNTNQFPGRSNGFDVSDEQDYAMAFEELHLTHGEQWWANGYSLEDVKESNKVKY